MSPVDEMLADPEALAVRRRLSEKAPDPAKDGRHPLRVAAFEDGIEAVERNPDLEEALLSGSFVWWPAMAPLTRNERNRVLHDVRRFAQEAKRVRLAAKK